MGEKKKNAGEVGQALAALAAPPKSGRPPSHDPETTRARSSRECVKLEAPQRMWFSFWFPFTDPLDRTETCAQKQNHKSLPS